MAEYIDREAAIAKCREIAACEWNHRASPVSWADAYEQFAEDIEEIPAADVAPVVHGRWIEKSAPARKIYFECSHCGAQENKHTAIKGHYCWRCGAKMDGGAD